jgi:hypothetical protein
MNMRFSSTVVLVIGLSWSVMAQGASPMREGMWEVTTKLGIPGMEGAAPIKSQQCITAENIKDPVSTMPKMDSNDCKLTNFKLSGDKATYTLTCTQPTEVTGNGEIKYSGSDSYTGTLTLNGGGMAIPLNYDAKRIGDCAK